MTEHDGPKNRNMDRWLLYWRPLELLIVFLAGLASGVVTTALLFKDHEKRISAYESWRSSHDRADEERAAKINSRLETLERRQAVVISALETRLGVKVQ